MRVRRSSDGALTQTIKGAAPPGRPFERLELEWPVDGDAPDLAPLADLLTPAAFADIAAAPVRPAYATDFRREKALIEGVDRRGAAYAVEVALDKGEIRAGERTRPIAEVEIELKSGSPLGVYETALRTLACGAAGLIVESKAARADRTVSGAPPAIVQASALAYPPDIDVGEAFAAIARNCMGQWAANYPNLIEAGEVEGIHQMRVAIRRLRSAIALYKGIIDTAPVAGELAALNRFFLSLGAIRDVDVLLAETLPRQTAAFGQSGRGRVARTLRARRARLWKALLKDLRQPAHTGMFLEIAIWLESGRWREIDEPLRALWHERRLAEFAPKRLDKAAKRARKAARRAEAGCLDDWHALRKILKKLRYSCEFFQALYPKKRTAPYIRALKRLQDELGLLNDMEVADRLLSETAKAQASAEAKAALQRTAAFCQGFLAGSARADIERLTERWRAFDAAEPFWRPDAPGSR